MRAFLCTCSEIDMENFPSVVEEFVFEKQWGGEGFIGCLNKERRYSVN